jgi:hypothetical protein
MEGIVVHLVIGMLLFTPVGFLTAMYQHRKAMEKAKHAEHSRQSTEK